MNEIQTYGKAPVSEVIFGVSFAERALEIKNLFEIQSRLKDRFSEIRIHQPIASESIEQGIVRSNIDLDLTGQWLLRLFSSDGDWLVQLQGNKVILNWIRKDDKPVGGYPGYTKIKSTFFEVFDAIFGYVPQGKISEIELTYQDRVEWKKYITSLAALDKIFMTGVYSPHGTSQVHQVNVRNYYEIEKLSGYSQLVLSSGMSGEREMLQIQYSVRSNDIDRDVMDWFDSAHLHHMEFFEGFFRSEVLDDWRK
jgi:uncharacterized protein (TIGR04255 family)